MTTTRTRLALRRWRWRRGRRRRAVEWAATGARGSGAAPRITASSGTAPRHQAERRARKRAGDDIVTPIQIVTRPLAAVPRREKYLMKLGSCESRGQVPSKILSVCLSTAPSPRRTGESARESGELARGALARYATLPGGSHPALSCWRSTDGPRAAPPRRRAGSGARERRAAGRARGSRIAVTRPASPFARAHQVNQLLEVQQKLHGVLQGGGPLPEAGARRRGRKIARACRRDLRVLPRAQLPPTAGRTPPPGCATCWGVR